MSTTPVKPKYPPRRSCGMTAGAEYIVTTTFDGYGGDPFVAGDRVVFQYEMYDVYDSCDTWTFLLGKRERVIYGYGPFADPEHWKPYFRPVG